MAKLAKLLQAAAGAGGGAALNVEDVFSTYLVELTASTSYGAVTNNIDLSGEGGLVWEKARNITQVNRLYDTERGATKFLKSDSTAAEVTASTTLTSFNSDGFTIDYSFYGSDTSECFWSFRKAPRFFDVQTWTGDNTDNRAIPHNLGTTVGSYFVKCTSDSSASDWAVWHKNLSGNSYDLVLNTTAAEANYNLFSTTAPDSSNIYLGTSYKNYYNATGRTYVAYIFAHNDGDGEFGPDGDADIIKCGSYTGGNGTDVSVDLGFEPQWVMVKKSSGTANWVIADNMRGISSFSSGNNTKELEPNTTDDESFNEGIRLNPDGFTAFSNQGQWNGNGTYIYIAIRRGPMAVPESADDVFGMSYAEDAINGTFPVDTVITTALSASDNFIRDRLRGTGHLKTNTNGTEGSGGSIGFDHMTGLDSSGWGTGYIHWLWRRAPNYFDVVCYEGNAVEGHDIPHNLGAVPEMIWVKNRETASQDWYVYHKDVGNTHYFRLNAAGNPVDSADAWNDTTPTDSVFTVGGAGDVNWNGINHVAYLFTSLAGISKVGSYAGNGSSQTIDCGFSSGARFVLIKGYNSTVNYWYVFDSERGIVAGNDPYKRLDENQAQVTSYDPIDPDSGGFIVNQVLGGSNVNYSGRNYIFYAIA